MAAKQEAKQKASLAFDLQQCPQGIIAGMDEAGRGPLAGPVVAACVILPRDVELPGIDDSKKLTEKKREALYDSILSHALAWGIGMRDAGDIDQENILRATRAAMEDAYRQMNMACDLLLVDSVKGLRIDANMRAFDHGDALSYHIAAASILAKVTRDRLMRQMDIQYPGYGFAKHKGYGTLDHRRAIETLGACPIHRRSFLKGLQPTPAQLGETGEEWALRLLMARGMQPVAHNYRIRGGECDLVAWDGETLVFVEVKTRTAGGGTAPREAVDVQKQQHLQRAAAQYLAQHQLQAQCRFDVVEVLLYPDRREITHWKDAFGA